MTLFLIALILQLPVTLPARSALQNPAITSPVPKKVEKDYDKLWKRFLTAKEDAKVTKDLEKFLKKNPGVIPGVVMQAYIDLYAGRQTDAERRLENLHAMRPDDPVALLYLGEFAYGRGDFIRANDFFTRLGNRSTADIDMKRQRSLLLAMEGLLQNGRKATDENRLADAERFYRQALQLAPSEALLHGQLAEVLRRAGKVDEAEGELRLQRQLSSPGTLQSAENNFAIAGLEDLGRWGDQIERFREIQLSKAITREQAAVLLSRYFPQFMEGRQPAELLTDVENSWSASAIQKVVSAGLLDTTASHTFHPLRTITRGEFAVALSRLTRVIGLIASGAPENTPLDVVPGSPLELELRPVLGYRIMALDNAGNFDVSAQVSGEEAVSTVEKLSGLMNKKAP